MRSDANTPEARWAGTALSLVTVGALIVVWSGIWVVYLIRKPPDHDLWYYIAGGLLLTGLTFLGGGVGLGLFRRKTEEDVEEGEPQQAEAS